MISASKWRPLEELVEAPGLLFVVSGPSGAGKDTLSSHLRRYQRLLYSVYCTPFTVLRLLYSVYCTPFTVLRLLYSVYCTPFRQPLEVRGRANAMPSTSFFLERDEFIRRRSNDGFLEWRE
jgi:hypothetical protein